MKKLFEILVPTEKPESIPGRNRYFTTRYHRVWDEHVRSISGGLSIFPKIKGQWVNPTGYLFKEAMIPVRIMASQEEMMKIVKFTAEYYTQEVVLAYEISDNIIYYASGIVNKSNQ